MPAHTASQPSALRTADPAEARTGRRRVGLLATALVDAAIIVLVNVWPGWQWVSVLTSSAAEVVTLLNLSLAAGIVLSLLQAVNPAAWLHLLAEVVTGALGLAVLMRTLRVFPFTFAEQDWAWGVRLGLVLLIVVTAIALVATVVRLVAEVLTHESALPR